MKNDEKSIECIFDYEINKNILQQANKKYKKLYKQYKPLTEKEYSIRLEEHETLFKSYGVYSVVDSEIGDKLLTKKTLIIATVLTNESQYQNVLSIVTAAKEMGYKTCILDLLKINNSNVKLFSYLINKYYKKNTKNNFNNNIFIRKISELNINIFKNIQKNIPIISTHPIISELAKKAKFDCVINLVPFNKPEFINLVDNSKNVIQTIPLYFSYKTLNSFNVKSNFDKIIKSKYLAYIKHVIANDISNNIDIDSKKRKDRILKSEPKRILLNLCDKNRIKNSKKIYKVLIKYLLPLIKNGDVSLYLIIGKNKNLYKIIEKYFTGYEDLITRHTETKESISFSKNATKRNITGIHLFKESDLFNSSNIFNQLVRSSDVLITNKKYLLLYPISKIYIFDKNDDVTKYSELKNTTILCNSYKQLLKAIKLLIKSNDLLSIFCNQIIKNNSSQLYGGANKLIDQILKK